MPGPLAPIIAKYAPTVAGVAYNAIKGKINRDRDIQDQRGMLNYQNQMNRRNWLEQNRYNSPTAQMQRLKAAGLNPNLVYAQGGSLSAAGEIASPSSTPFEPYIGNQDFQLQQTVNETEGLSADIARLGVQNDLDRASQRLLETQKQIADKDLNWKDRMMYQDFVGKQMSNLVNFQTAQNLESITGINRRDLDTYYLRLENTLSNDRVQRAVGRAGIDEVRKHIEQINSLISKTDNETKLLQLEYARSAIAKKTEQMALEWAQKFNDGAHTTTNYEHQLNKELELLEKEVLGKSIQNIENPISDILLPLSIMWIGRAKKLPHIGYK